MWLSRKPRNAGGAVSDPRLPKEELNQALAALKEAQTQIWKELAALRDAMKQMADAVKEKEKSK